MATEKTLAIVIRSVDFSETSSVVTLYTRSFGKIGALAKGAKRIRGPFSGALDLLSVSRIVLIRKQSGALDLLTEAELQKRFAPLRNSVQVIYAGYLVAELLRELTEENDPDRRVFDLATATLRALEECDDFRLVTRRFEIAILQETGHMPFLEGCVSCGTVLSHDSRWPFSVQRGGLVCFECGTGFHRQTAIHPGTARALTVLANVDNNEWRDLKLTDEMNRQMRQITRSQIFHLIGHKLRTTEFMDF